MASNRYIMMDPDILNHPLVGAGQPVRPADPTRGSFSRMESWFWLICAARFEPGSVVNKGHKMTLDRGEIMASYPYMATAWNWTVDTVREWIRRLVEDEMLAKRLPGFSITDGLDAAATLRDGNNSVLGSHMQLSRNSRETPEIRPRQITNRVQVLSVCNYSRFQAQPWETSQAKSQANPRPAPGQPQANPRNIIEVEREEIERKKDKQHSSHATPRTDNNVVIGTTWKQVAEAVSNATADLGCGDLSRNPNMEPTLHSLVVLANEGRCNLDADIGGTIRRVASGLIMKGRKVPGTWSYFVEPIKQARDAREKLEATAGKKSANGAQATNGHAVKRAESAIVASEYEAKKQWERDHPDEIARERTLGLR